MSGIHIVGKNNISAKVLADSVNANGKRITSFELELPRYIWAEVLTHRLFSRNAASSRAIPVKKKIGQVWSNPVIPIKWGKNKPGMQSSEDHSGFRAELIRFAWKTAAKSACIGARTLSKLGLHKQWAGRLLEPFEQYKVVLTATEFANWYWLRDHEDAQPEIRELATVMSKAQEVSNPRQLKAGEWHLPYITQIRNQETAELENFVQGEKIDLDTAIKVSVSCCAQVSYRVLDSTVKKALIIYDKLITSVPVHASPTEHQATPMKYTPDTDDECIPFYEWHKGTTHQDREGQFWSGNFCGWIQNRQLVPDHVKM